MLLSFNAAGKSGLQRQPRSEYSQVEGLTAFNLQGHRFQLSRGAFLFREEDPVGDLYGVIDGVLKADRASNTGARQILGYFEQGNVIGCAFSSVQHYAVTAITAATMLCFSVELVRQAAKVSPLLSSRLAGLTTRSAARISEIVILQTTFPANRRLNAYLLGLFNCNPLRTKSQEILELRSSRSDIAELLGLPIDILARSMWKLQDGGVVRVHSARMIELLDRAFLESSVSPFAVAGG